MRSSRIVNKRYLLDGGTMAIETRAVVRPSYIERIHRVSRNPVAAHPILRAVCHGQMRVLRFTPQGDMSRRGWLSDEDWRRVQRSVPVVCADVLPVREVGGA